MACVVASLPSCYKKPVEDPASSLIGTRKVTIGFKVEKWMYQAPYPYDDDDTLGHFRWTSPNMDDVIPYYSQSVIQRVVAQDSSGKQVEATTTSSAPGTFQYDAPLQIPRLLYVTWRISAKGETPNTDSIFVSIKY